MNPAEIQIEHNIPVPKRETCARWAALVERMNPGDSVVVSSESARKAIARALTKAGNRTTSIKLNGQGFRVWSLAAGQRSIRNHR